MSTSQCIDARPRVLSAVDAAMQAVDAVAAAPLWSCSDAESLTLLREVDALQRRVDALRLSVIADVESRGSAGSVGATSTAGWLRGVTLTSPRAASRDVKLGQSLTSRWTLIGEALKATAINAEQARACVRVLDGLPAGLDVELRVRAQEFMIDQAQVLDAQALSRVGAHLVEVLDPTADERMEFEEERAATRNEVTLSPCNGGFSIRGWLDNESGAALQAAIGSLAAPTGAQDEAERRTPAQRRGDGLAHLGWLSLTWGDLPINGGHRPHVTVTMTLDALQQRLGHEAADLDYGSPISAASARRIACDAKVLPVVLGSDSQPLDVGRSSYVVPPHLRRALAVRDGGCAFPGCDRPVAWTHAHHIKHWADNGETATSNLVLLCGHHHRVIHHGGWTVAIDATSGLPIFTPPAWAEPHTPRIHTPWRKQLAQLTATPTRGP